MLSLLSQAAQGAADPTGALGALYSFLLLLFITVVTLLVKVTLDLRALRREKEHTSEPPRPAPVRFRPVTK